MAKNNNTAYIVIGVLALAVLIPGVVSFSVKEGSRQPANSIISGKDGVIGKSLVDIQLFDKNDNLYDFSALKGKDVILFFNEGSMCYPACWNQIASFGGDPRFNNNEVVAISVVVDSPQVWQRAIDKMPELAKATTLFDKNANTSRVLGLLSSGSSMHAGQLPGHSYVLVDKSGVIREVFDDPSMGLNNDEIIKKLSVF